MRRAGVILSAVLVGPALIAAAWSALAQPAPPGSGRHLLLVLDGLRPDYVTPTLMPRLHALGQRGVVFENHHAVYPTVTRVNASSISTGAYPEAHGLLGNSVFFPQVEAGRFLDSGERTNLVRINDALRGDLLTTPTLGETLQAAGRRLLVVSAGGTGSAFLLNHRISGGAILHTEYTLPESLERTVVARLGPAPASPSAAVRNARAVDALLEVGLQAIDPAVVVLWLTDPDTTAHVHGIGSPVTVEALKTLDGEIGRLLDGLDASKAGDRFNVWATSDHGFSTYTGGVNLDALLKPFLPAAPPGGPPGIVAGGGAIYVRDRDAALIAGIVRALQGTPGVGAVFTRAARTGDLDGRLPGTLSFDSVRWSHARSADIFFSPDWTDATNSHGYAGTSASDGVAGHGSSSPYDIHNVLLAAGPDLKERAVVRAPTGNVDFAPSFLFALGLPVPPSMQGRLLDEAFKTGPGPSSLHVQPVRHMVRTPDGSYELTAIFSTVESGGRRHSYLDRTIVRRSPPRP